MATSIQKINGYELFAYCGSSASESIAFNEFNADLSDGFFHSAIYGADTGTRMWQMSFQTISGASADIEIDKDGVMMTAAKYIWDLFCRSKRTGRPFVIKSPLNDQYYLARFADKELSFEVIRRKLYSIGGIKFTQARVSGVSVFDTTKLSFYSHYNARAISGLSNGDTLTSWSDSSGNSRTLTSFTKNLDTIIHNKYLTNQQNGNAVVRLSQTGGTSALFLNEGFVCGQVIMILKVRESAFSSDAGIITSNESTDSPVLLGKNADTKFYNLGFNSAQEYAFEKNSIEYAENNQLAPMNEFGLIYLNFEDGVPLTNLQIGLDRESSTAFALMDIGEIFITAASAKLPDSDARELIEHLCTIWGIY